MVSINLKSKITSFIKSPGVYLGLFAFYLIYYAQLNFDTQKIREREVYVAPPQGILHFTFGNKDAIADLLWVRAIQDFDYCERTLSQGVCKANGWLSQVLLLIAELSPHFRMPMATGVIALDVLVGDPKGAGKLVQKGVANFPNDWPILYRGAYHYIFEEDRPEVAADYLRRAGQNGAPPWVYSLAGKLYEKAGKMELGWALLKELEDSHTDPRIIDRLRQRLESNPAK